MSSGQKAAISFLSALFLFVIFLGFANPGIIGIKKDGLMSKIETRFYKQSKILEKQLQLDKLSDGCNSYISNILSKIETDDDAFMKDSSVKTYLFKTPDVNVEKARELVKQRMERTSRLQDELPGLLYFRLIDNNKSNNSNSNDNRRDIHYSTFSNDEYSRSGDYKTFKNYADVVADENELDADIIVVNGDRPRNKFLLDQENNRFIISFPFYRTDSICDATLVCYFNIADLIQYLMDDKGLLIGQSFDPVTEALTLFKENKLPKCGFVAGIPHDMNNREKSLAEFYNPVIQSWSNKSSVQLERILSGDDYSWLIMTNTSNEYFNISAIYKSTLFELPFETKILIYVAAFISLLLICFLIFSIKRDYVTIIRSRIKRIQLEIIREYLENHDKVEWNSVSLQIAARKDELNEEIKKSLGIGKKNSKKAKKYTELTDTLLEASWEEILNVIGGKVEKNSDFQNGATIEEIRRVLEEVLQSAELNVNIANVKNTRSVPQVSQNILSDDGIEEIEEIDDIDEVQEVEEIDEVDEIDEIDEIEEIEDANDINEAEEIEAIDDFESLEDISSDDSLAHNKESEEIKADDLESKEPLEIADEILDEDIPQISEENTQDLIIEDELESNPSDDAIELSLEDEPQAEITSDDLKDSIEDVKENEEIAGDIELVPENSEEDTVKETILQEDSEFREKVGTDLNLNNPTDDNCLVDEIDEEVEEIEELDDEIPADNPTQIYIPEIIDFETPSIIQGYETFVSYEDSPFASVDTIFAEDLCIGNEYTAIDYNLYSTENFVFKTFVPDYEDNSKKQGTVLEISKNDEEKTGTVLNISENSSSVILEESENVITSKKMESDLQKTQTSAKDSVEEVLEELRGGLSPESSIHKSSNDDIEELPEAKVVPSITTTLKVKNFAGSEKTLFTMTSASSFGISQEIGELEDASDFIEDVDFSFEKNESSETETKTNEDNFSIEDLSEEIDEIIEEAVPEKKTETQMKENTANDLHSAETIVEDEGIYSISKNLSFNNVEIDPSFKNLVDSVLR